MVRARFLLLVAVMVVAVAGQALAYSSCEDRHCFEIYRPVCGSDGKTYVNRCTFYNARCKNRRLKIAYEGECRPSLGCPRICTLEYEPVCGTDGVTYSNRCMLNAARECQNKPYLREAYPGQCQPQY